MGVVVSRVSLPGGGCVGVRGGRRFRWSLLSLCVPFWCRPAVSLWRSVSGCSLPVRAVFGWGCGVGVGLPVSSSLLFVWGVRCGGGVVLFVSSSGFSGVGASRLLRRWRSARRRVARLGRVPRGSVVGSLCWLAGRPSLLVVGSLRFGRRPWVRGFWGAGRRWC